MENWLEKVAWGRCATNEQIPRSAHLAPYPLLLSRMEDKVKVLIYEGTENERLGRGRTNTGCVCGRARLPGVLTWQWLLVSQPKVL